MIFISYRISDSIAMAGRLEDDLVAEFGPGSVFRDQTQLAGGDTWTEELERNAQSCTAMLVVIGKTWQTVTFDDQDRKGVLRLSDPDDWVRKEITLAIDAGRLVIPVLLDGAAMPTKAWLAMHNLEVLYSKQGVPLRNSDYGPDFVELIALLRDKCPNLRGRSNALQPERKALPPTPPNLYAVPNYILTNGFVGRSSELTKLDTWATSSDAIMVIEGIGGLGKSALTWEWTKQRAATSIPDYVGGVWWSFYEKGTSMVTFVRHALAYVLGVDPESLIKDSSHYQRGQHLLAELRQRPFLLVLDGFERVLTAYHRLDKAQIADDQVEKLDLRECINPADGELLTQLLRCGPSKILISSRLFPTCLEDRASHKPINGVAHQKLDGLSPPDALALMRQAGVTGNEAGMLAFADQFGRHSLLLRIVCGLIADYRKKPLDFDAWRADPLYGGSLKLTHIDLKQRYTHILAFALAGLDEHIRKLLSRIAVVAENATYDTLMVLNPFMPPYPKRVDEPGDPAETYRWQRMPKERQKEARKHYVQLQAEYREYQTAVREYDAIVANRRPMLKFDAALRELEDRGLLQWDRDTNRYDMHPVVRSYAAESLEANDRVATFDVVRDHFAALPPDDLSTATELAHVTQSLEIYRCLIGADKFDKAIEFYNGDLGSTLLFHLGAHAIIVELLLPLFRNDPHGLPSLQGAFEQSLVLTVLAIAYCETGRTEEALSAHQRSLQLNLQEQNWSDLSTGLRNLQFTYCQLNRRAHGAVALTLARNLAEAADDYDGVSRAMLDQMCGAINRGLFADADAHDAEFRKRFQPQLVFYRPGGVEFLRCVSRFYQGQFDEIGWQASYDLAVRHRNVRTQYLFLALRAEFDLGEGRALTALDAIDQALQITNKLGTPRPEYHDLRAWALTVLGRVDDARAELHAGEQRLFAAEALRSMGELDQARVCALNAYRWAWGEGPPYIHWFHLKRASALLRDLGVPEPLLPPFDPAKMKSVPFEREIRGAIARLNERKLGRERLLRRRFGA